MSPSPKTLSADEVHKLLAQFNYETFTTIAAAKKFRNRLIVLLMLEAGLRVNEVSQLRIYDLFLLGAPVQTLIVRSAIAKNKNERSIPVSEKLQTAINDYFSHIDFDPLMPESKLAFITRDESKPLTTRQLQRIIETLGNRAFGRKINPHMLRHTFASRLMRLTNARIVQELLGHKNLSSTQIYTHPNHDDLKSAIDQM